VLWDAIYTAQSGIIEREGFHARDVPLYVGTVEGKQCMARVHAPRRQDDVLCLHVSDKARLGYSGV